MGYDDKSKKLFVGNLSSKVKSYKILIYMIHIKNKNIVIVFCYIFIN